MAQVAGRLLHRDIALACDTLGKGKANFVDPQIWVRKYDFEQDLKPGWVESVAINRIGSEHEESAQRIGDRPQANGK